MSLHRNPVLERGCDDERIAHLQPVAQGDELHQRDGAQRDRLGDWQQRGRAPLEHLLHRREFGLVAHAL